MDAQDLLIAAIGVGLGGFLKGATGAGAPVVGVPILAMVLGVQNAVAIFALMNLFSNIWQAWAYRAEIRNMRFVWSQAIAGAIGAFLGTFLLAWLSTDVLLAGVACIVFLYVGLRLLRPDWQLDRTLGYRLAAPAGLVGGLMQGAGGISAPVSVTYLNAMRLDRSEFVATISVFFMMMAGTQVPALIAVGLLNTTNATLALFACIPLFGAMPIGAYAARRISKEAFDKLVLALLILVALRLTYLALG